MNRTLILTSICMALMMLPDADLWGRGFGGGGRGGGRGGGGRSFGGGGGSRGGGGFSGGMNRGGGGFNRGGGGGMNRGPSGFSGGGINRGPSGLGGGSRNRSPGGFGAGGSRSPGGFGSSGARRSPGGFGAGGPGAAGLGGGRVGSSAGPGGAGNRFSAPSSSQLGNFLGLPSDGGLHGLGSPGGVGGPDSGIGVRPGAGAGRPGVGAGGIGGPDSGIGVRPGAGAGRAGVGVAGGFNRVTPSERYTTASGIRSNYDHWGTYSSAWYNRYPSAWHATGWTAGYAWNACNWDTMAGYYGYGTTQPVYYDYGNNVTYQGNNVYVNGQEAGTSEEYYDQASQLASSGSQAEASQDGDWLPLGVFALTQTDQKESDVSIQLAVNKQGVIRGNYTDQSKNQNQVVQGSVDKQSQKAAFTVGDNTTNVYETGLYNLTKDEAPLLLHLGKDQTQQLLLVRLKKDDR